MDKKDSKFITTTLPYINSKPHIGHAFEFCLADTIASLYRFFGYDVLLNVGVDEHGLKIQQKAAEEGYENTQDYCDKLAAEWELFCKKFKIDYDNFYRTSSTWHKKQVLQYLISINEHLYRKSYKGKYCVGCESFKTEKDTENNKCLIHQTELLDLEEDNLFFKLTDFNNEIEDVLIDKTLSNELKNLLEGDSDLSITRRNVDWGVHLASNETIYVWFDALLNYIFAAGYNSKDVTQFGKWWSNSLQICGKDNLKFQAQIFQAMLLASGTAQTKEILVHGTILDENGTKMSKTLGNVIDPIEQREKFGLGPVKYYLTFGLSTTGDSKYSEKELINLWNSDIVNGFGNLVSRTLHLINIKNIEVPKTVDEIWTSELDKAVKERIFVNTNLILYALEKCELQKIREVLNSVVDVLNKRFQDERPFDKACENYEFILFNIYCELRWLSVFYQYILKDYKIIIELAFKENKKAILFQPIKLEETIQK